MYYVYHNKGVIMSIEEKERLANIERDKQTMEVAVPLGTMVMTHEQVSKSLDDLKFLKDSVMVLLNPEYCDKCWDIPFDLEETLKHLREFFDGEIECSDWIEGLFKTSPFIKEVTNESS